MDMLGLELLKGATLVVPMLIIKQLGIFFYNAISKVAEIKLDLRNFNNTNESSIVCRRIRHPHF